jgi:hypothetical protein
LLVKLMHGDHEDSMLDGIKTEKKCTSEWEQLVNWFKYITKFNIASKLNSRS